MIRSFAFIVLIGAVLTGCRGLAPGASGAPVEEGLVDSPSATATASASPEEGASPAGSAGANRADCPLGFGIAEHHYPGLREFARMSDGVAIAEVVSVGEPQYSTEDGERPSCDSIEEAEAVFTVGRLVELRIVAPVAGRGGTGEVIRYLFPGGSIGPDVAPGHHFGVGIPEIGDRMLVLLMEPPFDADPGEGVLEVDVLELFGIANGRVATPDANERVTVDNVRDVVRGAVPSAPPGG